jgi:hypothetical protein
MTNDIKNQLKLGICSYCGKPCDAVMYVHMECYDNDIKEHYPNLWELAQKRRVKK